MEPTVAFFSPSTSLLSRTARPLRLPQRGSARLASMLEDILSNGAPGILAGVIPFDILRNPPALWRITAQDRPTLPTPRRPQLHLTGTSRSAPCSAGYIAAVDRALERLGATPLRKVVLARCVEFQISKCPPPLQVAASLRTHLPQGYVYAIDVGPDPATPGCDTRCLVGASPELLLRKTGAHVESNPLAGSSRRSSDPLEDRRQAALLLESEKDRREHQYVVSDIARTLARYCKAVHVPSEPSLTCTESMWHLSTRITGTLRDANIPSTTLALALHPTPAICGTPTILARDTITELEPFDRRYFTGVVGWCDSSGDGEWAVAIRCAELGNDVIRTYAGAGIVEGSVPERELLETAAKLQTIQRALGLGPTRSVDPVYAEVAE